MDGGQNAVSNPMMNTPEFKIRLFLFVACLWPFWVLALFGASAPGQNQVSPTSNMAAMKNDMSSPAAAMFNSRLNLRSVLDRVDVMGYGPTHPRVAVVIVGEDKDDLVTTVKSVFSSTDINRIFVVCAVLDGHDEDLQFVKDIRRIESGGKFLLMQHLKGGDNRSDSLWSDSYCYIRSSSLAWDSSRFAPSWHSRN
jgi:hypothetical protein